MRTLKEAYESIGETLQVGDIIERRDITGRWAWRQIVQSVDGWYFTDTNTDSGMCYTADKIEGSWFKHIVRNGKQIYQKVEEPIEEVAFNRERLKAQLILIFKLDGSLAGFITSAIEKLIEAKIKEKMGEK